MAKLGRCQHLAYAEAAKKHECVFLEHRCPEDVEIPVYPYAYTREIADSFTEYSVLRANSTINDFGVGLAASKAVSIIRYPLGCSAAAK